MARSVKIGEAVKDRPAGKYKLTRPLYRDGKVLDRGKIVEFEEGKAPQSAKPLNSKTDVVEDVNPPKPVLPPEDPQVLKSSEGVVSSVDAAKSGDAAVTKPADNAVGSIIAVKKKD